MRLLNTETLRLEEFLLETEVEYAILSHRWAMEEVLFADMQDLGFAREKRGFEKIESFCRTAANYGFKYGWVDTCCIDKSSSAELSEAINSMFRWYRASGVCIVYLADVDNDNLHPQFSESEWFTRGWTLQELIAPKVQVFYDQNWNMIGDRKQLEFEIACASGITEWPINATQLDRYSIATRMLWASRRVTTRPEDMAYSLLGIFDVNMPLLYGEGIKAFQRLQGHIVQDSIDRSIFIWARMDGQSSGVFAKSPACFRPMLSPMLGSSSRSPLTSSYSLTNGGLSIEVDLWPVTFRTYFAAIHIESSRLYCIFLKLLYNTKKYIRIKELDDRARNIDFDPVHDAVVMSANKVVYTRPCMTKTIEIQRIYNSRALLADAFHHSTHMHQFVSGFNLKVADYDGDSAPSIILEHAMGDWNAQDQTLDVDKTHIGTAGIFSIAGKLTLKNKNWWVPDQVLLGFDFDFNPVCIVSGRKDVHSLEAPTKSAFSSQSYMYERPDDIAGIHLEQVTCLETYGWSHVGDTVKEVPGRSGRWALKLGFRTRQCLRLDNTDWCLDLELVVADKTARWDVKLFSYPTARIRN